MNERHNILLIDDDERILRSLRALLRSDYKVKVTTDPHEAIDYLKKNNVMAIVSDMRMPIMNGVEVLQQAMQVSPGTMRLLLTGYADKESVIDSVNHGEIYRYINKPWDGDTLKAQIAEAVDVAVRTYHLVNIAEEELKNAKKPVALVLNESRELVDLLNAEIDDKNCEILYADNLEAGYEILANKPVDILLTDTVLADMDMTKSLKVLKSHYPELITIVTTSYQDSNLLISLINEGQVFRFLLKPISKPMLIRSFISAKTRVKQNEVNPQLTERNKVKRQREFGNKLIERLTLKRRPRAGLF